MAKLKLTLACDRYAYLQPLREGRVQAEGLDINFLTVSGGIRHRRMYAHGEYDASEFSVSSYVVARGKGIDWLDAIPFFPRRIFCHEFCFLRAGSDVEQPSDLKGRKFGLPDYETTSAVMIKGIFMHDYKLSLEDVTWVCISDDMVGSAVPSGVTVERRTGVRFDELLRSGEIEGALDPHPPEAWLRSKGPVQRLFPDYLEEERRHYGRAKIFPIMHTVVIKREILKREPWVASSLFDALSESRKRAYAEAERQPLHLGLAWGASYFEQERASFGRDPYAQGLKANRHDLETLLQFSQEQGLLARPLTPDELFTPNVRET